MNLKLLQHSFFYLCIFFIGCSSKQIDQEAALQALTPCECNKAFDELVQKLEANYIALALQKNTEVYQAYESRKEEFAAKSIKEAESSCTALLSEFLSFFDDGHLFIWNAPRYDEDFLMERKAILSQEKLSRTEIDRLLEDRSDPIIGEWSDGESIFAIVKKETSFHAYLIKSTKEDVEMGSIKMKLEKHGPEYIGTYIPFSYNERFVRAALYRKGEHLKLIMGGGTKWQRTEEEEIRSVSKAPAIEKIAEGQSLLSIPSFSYDAKAFKSFLKDHDKLIKNSQHLIIDIRGNTGGNAIYFPLIEYFANKTLSSKQGYVLASADNRAYFEKFIGFGSSKVYSPLVDRMAENGKIVDGPQYIDRKFKVAKNKIEQVSILSDEGCQSASESFILAAKGASDKVVTLGTPTGGVIDYTSVNLLLLKNSGRQKMYFGYPTGTLHQDILENGYNKTGILPDIPLPETEDWVQAAIDHFHKTKSK
ncbi:MAG: S41 family peptidase [Bacteroidota bacterium]